MTRTPTGFRLKNTPWARSSRMPPSCDFASRMCWERVSTVVTGRDDYDPPAFLNQLLWQLVRDSTPGFPKKAQTQASVQPFTINSGFQLSPTHLGAIALHCERTRANYQPSDNLRRIPTTVPMISISPGVLIRNGRWNPFENGRITSIFPSDPHEVQMYWPSWPSRM